MRMLAMFAVCNASLLSTFACHAITTYADSTFDLSDYSISQHLQAGTASVTQSLSGGNPGSALSVDFVVPPGPPFTNTYGNVYYLNKNFTYDPGADGALKSIDWSIDKEVNVITPTNFGLINGQSFIVFQAGNYYVGGVALGSAKGVYQTARLTTSLTALSRVTDLASGATDSTSHPSFSTGPMQFGFRIGFGVPPQVAAELVDLEDNFKIALTPVPEPDTCAMLIAGLGLLAWRRRAGRLKGRRYGDLVAHEWSM